MGLMALEMEIVTPNILFLKNQKESERPNKERKAVEECN